VKLFNKNLESEIAVIAEIGVNHEGDIDTAARLIQLSHEAGADAVKLQTYTPDRYASASDPDRLQRVTRFNLDQTATRRLVAHAAQVGVPLFSTALTEDVVPFLSEWCEVIKIASGDLTFEPVIKAASASGKPVIISTGNGSIEEIDCAVAWCRDEVGEKLLPERIVLMHCVSAYPTPVNQANVLSVPYLKQRYGITTGYSNHVVEKEAVLAAVALGAQMVEVHVTDRREGRTFRDHAMSYEPHDLADLIMCIKRTRASLGSFGKPLQECELPIREMIRKGVVAACDLSEGTILSRHNLMYARPAIHIRAAELSQIVGRRLLRSLRRGELILREDLR